MRTLFATAMFLALASGAEAYCFPVPDTADTNYVNNDLKRTLCLQNELAQSTNQRLLNSQIDATLNQLQRDLQQQKFMLQQLQAQSMLPSP
jgi:hypothetical protein